MSNRNSVFASLNPTPAPSYVPAPAPAPEPRPSVPEQEISALKQKIDAMEENILKQLEKKVGECLRAPIPPPPPPPPPAAPRPPDPDTQFLLARISELDKRLEEFARSALVSSAHIKNVEESKISARREIEELLKVVREQQKYTELDRQMHDQLEKSWRRVEELEKKLMDFYGTVSKRPAPAEAAAEVYKIVAAGLEERLKPLEAALKGIGAKIESAPNPALGVESRVRELSAALDARLAGFASQVQQLHIDAFAGKERVDDILAEVKKDVLSSVREAFAEGSGMFIKHIDEAALDGRGRMDVFSKLVVSHIDGLLAVSQDGNSKLDALGSGVKIEHARTLAAVSAIQDEIERTMRAGIEAVAGDVRAENARQLAKIKESYGLASSTVAALSAVSGNVRAIEERVSGVQAGLKNFVNGLSSVNMDAMLGVSGAMVRKSFVSAVELTAELEKETLNLAKANSEITANIMRIQQGAGEK